MTIIRCGAAGQDMELEVDGHAAGAPEACAGISAIVEAVSTYVGCSDHVYAVYEHTVQEGYCIIRASGDCAAQEAWRMACIGLAQISMAYPEQVSVEWTGEA